MDPVVFKPDQELDKIPSPQPQVTSEPPLTSATVTNPQLETTPNTASPVSANNSLVEELQPQRPVSELFAPDAPSQSGFSSASSLPSQPKTKGSKKKLIIAAGAAFVLLLGAGTVFGLILPNRPEQVWGTGIDRSGKALSKLITTATEKSSMEAFEKSDITATLTAKYGEIDASGTFAAKFDTKAADGSLVVKYKDGSQAEKNFSFKFLTNIIEDHAFPTGNFQFTGIKDLGIDAFMPGLSAYDGKWITIDEEYLKSAGLDTVPETKEQLTSEDIAELARVASSVTTERVFTTNPTTAVFEKRRTYGKETVDGISAFKYEVGINRAHLVDYCKDMVDKVTATNGYRKLPFVEADSIETSKDSYKKECTESVDRSVKDTDTFTLWIDAKYKLIYKVRLTDKDNKDNYVDIGQKYKGGDDVSLFVHGYDVDSKADATFTLSTNIKTNDTSAEFVMKGSGDTPYDVKVTLQAKPYTGEIDVSQPEGAVKIQDVFTALGFDPFAAYGSAQLQSKDIERQTDINALHAQLEAYYAGNSNSYPLLADVNDTTWRQENMPGFEDETLKDPEGTQKILLSNATTTQYGYSTTGCSMAECSAYELKAILSSGETYSKSSLNQ